MAPLDDTTPATRFDSFDVHRTSYKKIGDHEIEVGILIPKDLKPGKHPLVAKFHGGGLVTGTALYPDWIAAWFVPFLHRNSAIAVLPNYRLAPESSGNDILEDLADFWTWVHGGGLAGYLASQKLSIELDFDRLLVSGDSAGGYMALQSGLTRPKGEIKALLAQYPMTDILRRTIADKVVGMDIPPRSFVDDFIATMKPGDIISSATPPERLQLSFALAAHGRYEEFFGKGKHLWPITAVEGAKSLPPTLIIHGEQDTAVSIEDSRSFVKKVGELLPGTEVRLEVRDGEHGFDAAMKEDEETWLKEGLKWLEEKWLA